MSERPTPETDAETNYCDAMPDMPWVDAEVARKLERERDEAREKYDNLATEHMLAVNKLAQERDEWAAMCGRYKQERDEAITRRMETIMQCELYEEERDEALAELAEYRSIAENIGAKKAVSEKEKAIQERDEARELCRDLADLVAYGLSQSGEPWSLDAMRQATTAIQNAKALEGENDKLKS